MRSHNNSAYKYDMKSPLIGRVSNEFRKNFKPTKLLFDIEHTHPSCKTKCATICNKTVYKDFIRIENEEIESINPYKFSIISILVAILTLFIYCFQIAYYRNTANTFYIERLNNKHEFMREYYFYCWRIQSICIFLFAFYYIARYITDKYNISINKKNNHEEKKLQEDKKAIHHFFEIDWGNIIKYNNLKFAFINSLCYFIFLVSTKYLPLSICLFLNNSGMFLDFILKKKNKKAYFKHSLYLIFGFTFVYFSLTKDFLVLRYTSIFSLQLISGFLCIISSISQQFIHRHNMNEIMLKNSPLSGIIIIHINSLIISSTILMIIEIIHYKLSIYDMFIWLLDWNSFIVICLGFGILGIINSLLTIFSSIYLKNDFLKLIKIIEIPFSDFMAFSLLQLYSLPTHSEYYLAIINFTIYIAYIQYSKKN